MKIFLLSSILALSAITSNVYAEVSINSMKVCEDHGGVLALYRLSDGKIVHTYYVGDEKEKAKYSALLTIHASNKKIKSYTIGGYGSNCGEWTAHLKGFEF